MFVVFSWRKARTKFGVQIHFLLVFLDFLFRFLRNFLGFLALAHMFTFCLSLWIPACMYFTMSFRLLWRVIGPFSWSSSIKKSVWKEINYFSIVDFYLIKNQNLTRMIASMNKCISLFPQVMTTHQIVEENSLAMEGVVSLRWHHVTRRINVLLSRTITRALNRKMTRIITLWMRSEDIEDKSKEICKLNTING